MRALHYRPVRMSGFAQPLSGVFAACRKSLNRWQIQAIRIGTLTVAVIFCSATSVGAISSNQANVLNQGIFYFDTEISCNDLTSSSSASLSGDDNGQKIFNFFVSKGYSQDQAAGIVGNTKAESGNIPTRLQEGAIAGVKTISYAQIPANITSNQRVGWGMVQWTPPSKIGAYAQTTHENPDDLATQVEFLWKQLEGTAPNSNEKPAGDALKETTNYSDAALAFMNYYERPQSPQQDGPIRVQLAKEALAAYGGSSTGSLSSSAGSCSGGATGCSVNTGKYAALVGPGASFAGVDQGIDFVPVHSTGYNICAPAAGTITLADQTGHHYERTTGQAEIIEKLDQNPNVAKGSQYIYYAEIIQINSNIHVGTHVNAGDVIGTNAQSPGIEVGWASDGVGDWLCAPGIPTPCGTSFNNWILQRSANIGKGEPLAPAP